MHNNTHKQQIDWLAENGYIGRFVETLTPWSTYENVKGFATVVDIIHWSTTRHIVNFANINCKLAELYPYQNTDFDSQTSLCEIQDYINTNYSIEQYPEYYL